MLRPGPSSVRASITGFLQLHQVHAIFDGALGNHPKAELLARGIHAPPFGLMESGFRHVSTTGKPVMQAPDPAGPQASSLLEQSAGKLA